jgi:hypothetical protein
MMITPGSLSSPGVLLESFGFLIEAVLVIMPVVAVTFTGIVISGSDAFGPTEADVVQVTPIPMILHDHPAHDGIPADITPRGR